VALLLNEEREPMPRWNSFDAFLAEAKRAESDSARQQLVDALLADRPTWPWVHDGRATFIYAQPGVFSVALNMDVIKGDPPFAPMTQLAGTSLWYATAEFNRDDLLDYLLAVDDPMTPLADEKNIVSRMAKHWRPDPRNPLGINTGQVSVSVVRMGLARPFPDWGRMPNVERGSIYEHPLNSVQLGFSGRKLWVYTPPGYEESGMVYPLLVLEDGQWAVGPLQVPYIADALIKHGRMKPVVIAMRQSGDQRDHVQTYVNNDRHYAHILTEVLPLLQTQYRIDSTNLGIGGFALSAIGAAHAALKNPAVFSALMMISPPLGKGIAQEQLQEYASRFEKSLLLPRRIFQSVGRYEAKARFYRPAVALSEILSQRQDVAYKFTEIGSGHGLVAFKSILPEALAWMFPGDAFWG
jgi:enterochelin esterase-like enzyme